MDAILAGTNGIGWTIPNGIMHVIIQMNSTFHFNKQALLFKNKKFADTKNKLKILVLITKFTLKSNMLRLVLRGQNTSFRYLRSRKLYTSKIVKRFYSEAFSNYLIFKETRVKYYLHVDKRIYSCVIFCISYSSQIERNND